MSYRGKIKTDYAVGSMKKNLIAVGNLWKLW